MAKELEAEAARHELLHDALVAAGAEQPQLSMEVGGWVGGWVAGSVMRRWTVMRAFTGWKVVGTVCLSVTACHCVILASRYGEGRDAARCAGGSRR